MEDPNKWLEEVERVKSLEEKEKIKLPFGYDFILESLNDIALRLTPETLFQSGVKLGLLIETIIMNKEEG